MKIEIVEAYATQEKNKYSMHVYLPDEDLDIRGIHVIFGKKWLFYLPSRINIDEGVTVRFPLISFCNPEKSKDFLNSLIEKGTSYMQAKQCELDAARKPKPKKQTLPKRNKEKK